MATVNISERFGDVLDGLGGGDDYRCRFGPLAPPNETRWDVADAEAAGLVVRATYDATSGTVACVSPPQQAGTVALQLALNAFHYRKVVDFDFYNVPIVSSLARVGPCRWRRAAPRDGQRPRRRPLPSVLAR